MKNIGFIREEDYRIFSVRTLTADVNKETGTFYQISAPNWVNIIAVKGEQYLIESQFRIGIEREVLELPGGIIENDESPVDAALRELEEETGYTGRARLVGKMHANPAIMTNQCFTVIVEDLYYTNNVTLDPFEQITTNLMTLSQIEATILDGRFSNALHIASLYQYLQSID